MIKIENHLEVYVDSEGNVCLAQASMDEECEIALEAHEAETLIIWLRDALNKIAGTEDIRYSGDSNIKEQLLSTQ